jgi:type II secretory pathway pseudopilin PulG
MRNDRPEQGYTLVEMMAALLVALLVLGLVFTIRQYTEKAERAILAQTDLQEQLRQIEELLVPAIRDSDSIVTGAESGETVITIRQTGEAPVVLAVIRWNPTAQTLNIRKNDPTFQRTFEHISQFSFTMTNQMVHVQVEGRNEGRSFRYSFSASPRL